MKKIKQLKKNFPLDFYGEDKAWRFAVRACNQSEVVDALMWCSYLSLRREEINLLHLAVRLFPYECDSSKESISKFSGAYGCLMRVKMMGPVVEVSKLNEIYRDKLQNKKSLFAMGSLMKNH